MIPKLDFADAKLFYDLWIPLRITSIGRTTSIRSSAKWRGRWAGYPRGTGGSRFPVEPSRGH